MVRLVDTGKREHKTPQYLAMNPNGVVPTLLVDGAPMSEAAASSRLLATRTDALGFGLRSQRNS